MTRAEEIIERLGLTPHSEEGGFFREIYRCSQKAEDGRTCGTSIYYLLRRQDRSKWHRVASDEIWLYHAGASILQHIIAPDGRLTTVVIGGDVTRGEFPQSVIPAGYWQTAILNPHSTGDWGLVGATVFPGFEYEDFIGAEDEEICRMFPQLAARLKFD
ncbi:MAG: cupin domain-containing protein [Thermoguttaceae bacterium]|nr:cupin domain-containing protein [Thermoguttaceae bacterium]